MFYHQIEAAGLRVYLVELPKRSAEVPVEIFVPAGFLQAPPKLPELPHLLEHYLANVITPIIPSIHGTTDLLDICLDAEMHRGTVVKQLPLLLKALLDNPLDQPKIFEREHMIVRNEIEGSLHNPVRLSDYLNLNTRLVDQASYSLSTKEFGANSWQDAINFYTHSITPERTRVFVGVHKPTTALIESLTIALKQLGLPKRTSAKLNSEGKLSAFAIAKHNLEQGRIHLTLTWPGPFASAEPIEFIGTHLVKSLLIEEDESLLWQALRWKRGLVYSIDGEIRQFSTFGDFSIQTAVLAENLESCLAIILQQVEKIKAADFSDSFLRKLKKSAKDSNHAVEKDNQDTFSWVVTDILDRKKVYSAAEWNAVYEDMDKQRVAEMAIKYLDDAKLNIILVGDNVEQISDNAIKKIVQTHG